MEESGQSAARRSEGNGRVLLAAMVFSGLLGVMWLVIGDGSLAARTAAGAISGLAIVVLAGQHRRRAGDEGRESEILAERLVQQSREMQQKLAESNEVHQALEHYFEALMEHVQANIYFKDEQSRFLRVNQSMAEHLHCGHPVDLVGKRDHDFFEAEHADRARADEKRIIKSGKAVTGLIEHETYSDGSETWVLTNKMPFRDRSGRIIGTFGMSSDVTELEKARVALERERNMLRSLIDSFPDPIFVRDPGRTYLVVNKAMAQLAGVEGPAKMIGRKPEDFFPQNESQRGADEDLEVLASGEPLINREWTYPAANGEPRHLLTTKVPLLDKEGRSWGVVGMDRDITEQRRAREELKESEQRMQELMDNSPAVISLKDLDGRYLMINQEFEKMYGLARREVLGRTDHDLLADKAAANQFRQHDLSVISSGQAVQIDEMLYVGGEPRWFVAVRFPLRDTQGRIHAVAGISTDITDRKAAEEALRTVNDDLVSANDHLRQAHEQLIQAEKMESVGRLASGVAHEVKNPLAMIGMGLEVLARRVPEGDETAQETIERMKRGIERAKKIVKGLVDFSSARQLAVELVDPNEVVREALALVDYQLQRGKIRVVEELGEGLPEVKVDPTKVEQVLVNLLINAMHAMPEGGALTVRTYQARLDQVVRDEGLRTSEHLRAGDQVLRIEIDDEGTGIDEEHFKKLYDPFFTTKPTGKGTGLGLSVSRKIIALHFGMLELMNRPGGGVRAAVTLKI